MSSKISVITQESLGARGIFYVGGKIKGKLGNRYMCGQMFVEAYMPVNVTKPYPIIFFHGAGQTNVNWLMTPDGRMGWADYFVQQGYIVYLAEQPARGRSAYHMAEDGPRIFHNLENIQKRFTSELGGWSQAAKHTQWPDNGRMIDEKIFNEFAKSQVEYLPSNKYSQQLVLQCAEELLSKTGPAILLTHSQSGPFGWNILDAYPNMVKGVVALEPSGPPFSEDLTISQAFNYGISEMPLHFSPPIESPAQLQLDLLESPNAELKSGWILKHPPILPRFGNASILLIVSEASYHAQYDHLTSYFFTQTGVSHDFIRLEDVGIHGNGHMMMLEKNNLEIAAFINDWILKKMK